MNHLARMVSVASTLSLVLLLSNCSSFDPTDIMDNIFASQKKPLPGDRKPLFPSGTPGVPQGLPAELVKGYQPAPVDQDVVGPARDPYARVVGAEQRGLRAHPLAREHVRRPQLVGR